MPIPTQRPKTFLTSAYLASGSTALLRPQTHAYLSTPRCIGHQECHAVFLVVKLPGSEHVSEDAHLLGRQFHSIDFERESIPPGLVTPLARRNGNAYRVSRLLATVLDPEKFPARKVVGAPVIEIQRAPAGLTGIYTQSERALWLLTSILHDGLLGEDRAPANV